MPLAVGIVGLPNVGKSTLFKALTKIAVDTSNYPFATIDPNVGVVAVPDPRLDVLAKLESAARIVPTTIEFVDIAGLVRGAYKGEGLGNQFLSHIREVDAIVEVVRAFADPNVVHVDGAVDPKRDADTIATELALADLAVVERRRAALDAAAKAGLSREAEAERRLLGSVVSTLSAGKPARSVAVAKGSAAFLKPLNLLTAKPILFAVNVGENELEKEPALSQDGPSVVLSAKLEAELAELSADEAAEYVKSAGLPKSRLPELTRLAYAALDLLTFFTAGPKEARAWTVRRGTLAPQTAGVIHSDFERTFIRAEVVSYDDLVAAGSWAKAREAGTLRLEGKDYETREGDVVHFHTSA
jgi:GTP-binding protein YchF